MSWLASQTYVLQHINLIWYLLLCSCFREVIVFEPLKSEYWLDPNLLWVVAVVSRWLFVQQTPTLLCCQTHERDRYWLSLHLHIYPLYFVCFQQSIITGWLIKISQHKQLKHWQLSFNAGTDTGLVMFKLTKVHWVSSIWYYVHHIIPTYIFILPMSRFQTFHHFILSFVNWWYFTFLLS